MSCQGRLIREFPDSAAEVDRAVSLNSQFLDELASMLCQLELQESAIARPKSTKSGQAFDEERDTNSPFLVTDMVIGTIAGFGRSVEPQRISKRSREQVNWNSARLPFHRSPTWLLLLTALRLVLDRDSCKDGHALYKALMAFHHGRLLDQAVRLGLDREVRFVMGAKAARRVVKLGINTQQNPPWLQEITDAIKANHDELQRNWQQVQGVHATSQANQLEQLCFQTDANLRLQKLNQHLSWTRRRSAGSRGAIGPGDTTSFSSLPAGELPTLLSPSSNLAKFALLELELWFESNLSAWTAERLQANSGDGQWAEGDLQGLQQLMADYHTQASNAYEGNPEALSMMFLNIIDLWVALDKIAGAAVPLLLEYDPGFTADFLHQLVLPTKVQMARLRTIELYISRPARPRSSTSTPTPPPSRPSTRHAWSGRKRILNDLFHERYFCKTL